MNLIIVCTLLALYVTQTLGCGCTCNCQCAPGWHNDEPSGPSFRAKDCQDLLDEGFKESGVYHIYPDGKPESVVDVYCDQKTDGGGWTVFQRRKDGSVNFLRGWKDYVNGFGKPNGEFWLGLDVLARITESKNYTLRVDLKSFKNERRFAEYKTFIVGDPSTNYKLTVGSYSGTADVEHCDCVSPVYIGNWSSAVTFYLVLMSYLMFGGDSLTYHNGYPFSTIDRDNDSWPKNCAVAFTGAWWYKACHKSNLNGVYHKNDKKTKFAVGVNWKAWTNYYESLKGTEMKFRPTRK